MVDDDDAVSDWRETGQGRAGQSRAEQVEIIDGWRQMVMFMFM